MPTASFICCWKRSLFPDEKEIFHVKGYLKKYIWDLLLCVLIAAGLSVNLEAGFAGEGPLLLLMIMAAALPVVFFAGRTRAGLVILFLLGSLTAAAFAFLEYPVSPAWYAVFLAGVSTLYMYRVYCISLLRAESGTADYRACFIQSAAVSLTVILLAGAICFSVVEPLSLPTGEAKLTKTLMASELMQRLGISYETTVSRDRPAADKPTASLQEQPKTESAQNREPVAKEKQQQDQKKNGRIVQDSHSLSAIAVTFRKNVSKLGIAAAGILLLLLAAVMIRRLRRKKWYAGILRETNEDGAMKLYLYFMKKLRSAGHKRPEGVTLLEYALKSRETLARFTVDKTDFLALTRIYLGILYGYHTISEEEYESFLAFYKGFPVNLRKEMGRFRYFIKYLAI
jgi:hypothetical protein